MKRIILVAILSILSLSAFAEDYYKSLKLVGSKNTFYIGEVMTLEIVNTLLTSTEKFYIVVGTSPQEVKIDTTLSEITLVSGNTYRVNITVTEAMKKGSTYIYIDSDTRTGTTSNSPVSVVLFNKTVPTSVEDVTYFTNKAGNYSIYNTSGQLVKSYTGIGVSQELPQGVYVFKFESEKEFKTGKFLVK